MTKPAAVSVLLMALFLVNTIQESASWNMKSTHYRKRGNLNEDNRHKEVVWWMLPQNFSVRSLNINDKITFIENFTDYPEEMFKQVLKKEGKEHEDIFRKDSIFQERKLIPRIGPQETTLCPSLEQIVYPKVALSKNNEWKYVVNVGEEYVQGVRVETCGHLNKCSMSDSFPAGYTAMCEQKYVFRRLMSVADKGKPTMEEFRMPSCCSCIVKGPSEG